MVYKLYELTWDEALIVDPELPGIISQEDYEKAGCGGVGRVGSRRKILVANDKNC